MMPQNDQTSILDCPKNALSSQAGNFTLDTTFSHSLGQKYYRKPRFEKFYSFFDLANGVQSFST